MKTKMNDLPSVNYAVRATIYVEILVYYKVCGILLFVYCCFCFKILMKISFIDEFVLITAYTMT